MHLEDTSESAWSVARTILLRGPIARAGVVAHTGLTSGTVTKITKSLLARGLIAEGTPIAASTGRPSVPLSIVADRASCLGIKVTPGRAIVVRTGLTCQTQHREEVALRTNTFDELVAGLRDIITSYDCEVAGIVLPAAVARDGVLRATRMLGWVGGVNLQRALDELSTPCVIANDVQGLAQYAHWFGALSGVANGVLVTVGQGVGVEAVMDDHILTGHEGAAGILGRLWSREGLTFGEVLSIPALEAAATKDAGRPMTWPALLRDPAAEEAIGRFCEVLGQLVHVASVAYAPQRILLTGEASPAFSPYLDLIQVAAQARWREDLSVPELVAAPLTLDHFAVGAAALAIRELFLGAL